MISLLLEQFSALRASTDKRFVRFARWYFIAGLFCIVCGFFAYDVETLIRKSTFSEIRYAFGLYPIKPFSEGAIKDPKLLIHELSDQNTALSKKIFSTLSAHTQALVIKHDLSDEEFEELRHLLLYELNALLGTNEILDITLYDGLDLPSGLTGAIVASQGLHLSDRIRLSRLLLYAAYPRAISNRHLSRWDYWSLSALLLTVIFSLLFNYDCHKDTSRPALFKSVKTEIQYKIQWLFWFSLASVVAAAIAVFFHWQIIKLFSIALFFLFWCIIDGHIVTSHSNPSIQEEFRSLFWYIDFPFLVGLTVLLVFYGYLFSFSLTQLDPDADAFFAGAVAFKVILQNTNFLAVILRSFNHPSAEKNGEA